MAEEKLGKHLDSIEKAFGAADAAAGADRAAITKAAQLEAAEAVAMAGIAMEADAEAAEAGKMAILAERSGNKEGAKKARAKEREARKKAKADHKAATKSARKAYNAVRFSDPNGLGFLRVIALLLVINVVFSVFMLTTYIKGSYVFDFNMSMNLLNVLADGITVWLIWKRKKVTRTWVLAVSAISIVVGTAFNIVTGSFRPDVQLTIALSDIVLIVYFAT